MVKIVSSRSAGTFVQADEIEFFLQILERSGLRRTQQGAAFLITCNEVEEEVTVKYLSNIPREDLVQFKAVGVYLPAWANVCTAHPAPL